MPNPENSHVKSKGHVPVEGARVKIKRGAMKGAAQVKFKVAEISHVTAKGLANDEGAKLKIKKGTLKGMAQVKFELQGKRLVSFTWSGKALQAMVKPKRLPVSEKRQLKRQRDVIFGSLNATEIISLRFK